MNDTGETPETLEEAATQVIRCIYPKLNRYIEVDGFPTLEPNLLTWSDWFETADRTVAKTRVSALVVFTVFLGLDHQRGDGPPLLYQTMVFDAEGDDDDFDCARYATRDEALLGHAKVVARLAAASALAQSDIETQARTDGN